MEEMYKARYGKRAQIFHALSGLITLLTPPRVHQPRSSLNPIFLGFYYIAMID